MKTREYHDGKGNTLILEFKHGVTEFSLASLEFNDVKWRGPNFELTEFGVTFRMLPYRNPWNRTVCQACLNRPITASFHVIRFWLHFRWLDFREQFMLLMLYLDWIEYKGDGDILRWRDFRPYKAIARRLKQAS